MARGKCPFWIAILSKRSHSRTSSFHIHLLSAIHHEFRISSAFLCLSSSSTQRPPTPPQIGRKIADLACNFSRWPRTVLIGFSKCFTCVFLISVSFFFFCPYVNTLPSLHFSLHVKLFAVTLKMSQELTTFTLNNSRLYNNQNAT